MKKTLVTITCATLLAAPAVADPALGFGFNMTFGNGGVDYGIGARVFSKDEEDELAASVGLDYMFGSQSWRGSLGATYMMDDSYIELNGGYNFSNGGFDFGMGAGGANTSEAPSGDTGEPAGPENGEGEGEGGPLL